MNKNEQVDKEIKLNHQLEEWKLLNEYVNKMDLGYSQIIVIIITAFGIITAILSSEEISSVLKPAIFLVPIGIEAIFAYLSYQFRITAILRGHLAALEKKMNKKLGENTHLWNSVLMETYMSRNNLINNYMLLPMFMAVGIIIFFCLILTWSISSTFLYGKIVFFIYWILIAICAIIIILPFFQNEKIRTDTENEKEVIEKYYKYLEVRNKDKLTDKFKYEDYTTKEYKKKKQQDLKLSIGIAALNTVLSIGVFSLLYCLWWRPHTSNLYLPGLEYYYAATIGDGIFLSAFLGSSIYFLLKNRLKDSDNEKNMPILSFKFFAFGMIVGCLIQLSWIINDNTKLNWTIDKLHHFNLAGWYHAIYFVIMFGLILSLFARMLKVLTGKNIYSERAFVIAWMSLVGYLFMHYIDDHFAVADNDILFYITISACFLFFVVISVLFFSCSIKTSFVYIAIFLIYLLVMIVVCRKIGNSVEYSHNVLELLSVINNVMR